MLDQQLVALLVWLVKIIIFFFVLNKEYLLSYFLKIVLILDIIAAVEILRSAKPIVEKLLWILFIIFCPIIGKNKLLNIILDTSIFILYRFDCLFTLWSCWTCRFIKYSANESFCTINNLVLFSALFNQACIFT